MLFYIHVWDAKALQSTLTSLDGLLLCFMVFNHLQGDKLVIMVCLFSGL